MLYKNCRELPMHNFNEIDLTGDLSYLVKEGKHEEEELQRHWLDIVDEYYKLSKDHGKMKFFRDRSKLKTLEIKLQILVTLQRGVESKKIKPEDDRITNICRKAGVTSLEHGILALQDQINILISRLNKDVFKEKNSNFDEALAIMRMNGYNVDRYSIVVAEWVELMNQNKKLG